MSDKPVSIKPIAPQPIYYVGIGASAGGLEALEAFFNNMPPDSGMAFIVIQHLSPDYKSMMVELLSKRTAMTVQRAEEGMLVEPDHVYLIPPKKNLLIFHGKLLLSDQDTFKGINLPIDVFLRSLADDQAEKSIGVILSGTGSDGVRGVRAVKEAGGMIMVQSEESARFDGMPRSAISTGLADFILPPDEMPARLISFARHPYAPKPESPQALLSSEDGLARIFALLRERTRVDFTFYKPSTVVRRIERRMAFNQVTDLRDYVKYMETHPSEANALYRELLIGVTSFFRDREIFDELELNHLPALFGRISNREVRFWVAGCSTGEEAYTLAILSREVMEQLELRLDLKIFATDIDRDAIVKAGAGLYPESIAADVPPRLLAKYFHRRDDQFQIDRTIREMVVFAQHNLLKDPPFTNIDLVSCRNLLIYLQPVLQHKVMDLINFSLNTDGLLVLGTSETTGEMVDLFEPLHQKYKIYQSKGRRHPPAAVRDFVTPPEPRQWTNRAVRLGVGSNVLRHQEEERLFDRFLQSLAGVYVPLAIVVNEQMEVLHILGDPEGYFRLPSGKLLNDITRMAVKDLAIPLTTGLQKVFKSGEELKYTNIRLATQFGAKVIQMRIRRLPGKKGQEPLAAVFIEEATTQAKEQVINNGQEYDISQETEQRLHDLEQELQFTRENLQATIEELETSNEELQATNEELLASNEELQSTNEELQSVNEELHTVNAEYQSKIIELTELNNDLDNLMASTRLGTLFLDENLEIRRFTPEIKRLFKVIESDIGRPLHHITHTIRDIDLLSLVIAVEHGGDEIELEVQIQDGSWFLLRILPYVIGAGSASGVVLTFIEISKLKQTQSALDITENRLTSLAQAAPIGIGRYVGQLISEANPRLIEMLGYRPAELMNLNLPDLYPSRDEYAALLRTVTEQIADQGFCNVETRWRRKDGRIIPVLYSAAPVSVGDPGLGYTFTVLDLSTRKQAQAQAKASEARYRRLFDTMDEGVVYHNAAGEIISCNAAAERILGLSYNHITGRTSHDPNWRAVRSDGSDYPGEEHPAMVALRSGQPVYRQVMGVYNPSLDQTRWLRVTAIPLFEDGETEPSEVYAMFNDITEAWQIASRQQ